MFQSLTGIGIGIGIGIGQAHLLPDDGIALYVRMYSRNTPRYIGKRYYRYKIYELASLKTLRNTYYTYVQFPLWLYIRNKHQRRLY